MLFLEKELQVAVTIYVDDSLRESQLTPPKPLPSLPFFLKRMFANRFICFHFISFLFERNKAHSRPKMDLLSKFHNNFAVILFSFHPQKYFVSFFCRHWKILAHPEVVVPGEETVILLTKSQSISER